MENSAAFSLQARPIRQMQADDGQPVCFASEPRDECANTACHMRHECFGDFLDSIAGNAGFHFGGSW